MAPEVILGRDFLQQYECILDFNSNTLRSRPLAQLHLNSTIRIPAKGVALCQAKSAGEVSFVSGMIMEVFKTQLKPNVHTQPSFSKMSKHALAVQIYNNSETDQILHKNTVVASTRAVPHNARIHRVNVVSQPPWQGHSEAPLPQSQLH